MRLYRFFLDEDCIPCLNRFAAISLEHPLGSSKDPTRRLGLTFTASPAVVEVVTCRYETRPYLKASRPPDIELCIRSVA